MEVCGKCNQQFKSTEDYVGHPCSATGFTPRQPEHLGREFLEVSKAALERGMERLEDTADKVIQEAAISDVDQKLSEIPAEEKPAISAPDSYQVS